MTEDKGTKAIRVYAVRALRGLNSAVVDVVQLSRTLNIDGNLIEYAESALNELLRAIQDIEDLRDRLEDASG